MKTISLAFAALALAGNFAVAQDKTYPIGNTGMIGVRHGNVTRTYKNGVLTGGPGIIDLVNKSYTQYDHCGRVFGVSYVDGSGKIRKAFQMTRKQYAQPCRRKK
jgi:hypothetical protein